MRFYLLNFFVGPYHCLMAFAAALEYPCSDRLFSTSFGFDCCGINIKSRFKTVLQHNMQLTAICFLDVEQPNCCTREGKTSDKHRNPLLAKTWFRQVHGKKGWLPVEQQFFRGYLWRLTNRFKAWFFCSTF